MTGTALCLAPLVKVPDRYGETRHGRLFYQPA